LPLHHTLPTLCCLALAMPAERRTFTSARPVKTERTHEENQERLVVLSYSRWNLF
jgi:hypothetical protein